MIQLKNIVKKYNNLVAVNDLSLEVNSGEVLGLLGPNGAGKSTTMKIISGYIIPDEGDAIVNGVSVRENHVEAKKNIGYMPENNPLYKEMLVDEAIKFSLEVHNVPKSLYSERIEYVVEATGISEVFYRPIGELSKGYKQRVGLAQSLVHFPKVLILDEPTEGLDPNQRNEIRNLIKNLGKDRTVIISTHVMQEVEAMCSRIVIVNKGKIVLDGDQNTIKQGNFKRHEIEFQIVSRTLSTLEDDVTALSVELIQVFQNNNGVFHARVGVPDSVMFYENLATLIKSKDIVIHKLETRQQNLEDIFRELTQN
jgi:ABC-2 type transport system ATP-binding protein